MIRRLLDWWKARQTRPETPGKPTNSLWYKILALHIRESTK